MRKQLKVQNNQDKYNRELVVTFCHDQLFLLAKLDKKGALSFKVQNLFLPQRYFIYLIKDITSSKSDFLSFPSVIKCVEFGKGTIFLSFEHTFSYIKPALICDE